MQCFKIQRFKREQVFFACRSYKGINTLLIFLHYLRLKAVSSVTALSFLIQFFQVFLTILYNHTTIPFCLQYYKKTTNNSLF